MGYSATSLDQAAHRGPDGTRQALLSAAEHEIHLHGYQAASLSQIIKDAGVTKGALYHHFANKQALGYAVLDEMWAPQLRINWIEPLSDTSRNPVENLIGVIQSAGGALRSSDLTLGCPINNLAQEMSPIDEGSPAAEPDAAAAMLVASLEGCIGMAKNAQSKDLLMQCGAGLIDYLRMLRA